MMKNCCSKSGLESSIQTMCLFPMIIDQRILIYLLSYVEHRTLHHIGMHLPISRNHFQPIRSQFKTRKVSLKLFLIEASRLIKTSVNKTLIAAIQTFIVDTEIQYLKKLDSNWVLIRLNGLDQPDRPPEPHHSLGPYHHNKTQNLP